MRTHDREDGAANPSWVYRKQIDLLYEDMPFAIVSTALMVLLVFLILGSSLRWRILAVWFSFFWWLPLYSPYRLFSRGLELAVFEKEKAAQCRLQAGGADIYCRRGTDRYAVGQRRDLAVP